MLKEEQLLFLKSIATPIEEDITKYDIKEVLKTASKHGVLPLCYEHLSNAPGFDLNKNLSLEEKIFSTVFAQTKRTANFKKIYRVLLNNGIQPIVIKGIICRSLYGELCDHRPSGDEDILIKKDDFFKAQEILIDNGYLPDTKVTKKSLSGSQEITFRNKNGLNLEVHLNIIGTENKLRQKMNKYFDDAFEKTVALEIDGQKFFTLNYTENYIFLFFHLFKHFTTTGVGARQLLDMFLFCKEYGQYIDFDIVYKAIKDVNAHKFYGDVVEIGNRYMGFNIENPFGTTFPERLLEDIFFSGAYGNGTEEQIGSKVKVMAAIDSGGKMSKLRMLFPSLQSMREYYKILYNCPFLLPVMWVVRIFRYIFRFLTGKTYNVSKGEAVADNKISLLKDYHII